MSFRQPSPVVSVPEPEWKKQIALAQQANQRQQCRSQLLQPSTQFVKIP